MDREKTRHVFLELSEESTPEEVARTLGYAGTQVSEARAVHGNHDGYILTQALAQGIWDYETGAGYCKDNCPRGKKHRTWDQLSSEQQETFLSYYTTFVEQCRTDELIPEILLQDAAVFRDIALDRDQNEDDSDEDPEPRE